MADSVPGDVWAIGTAYEPYVGRWSRLVARELVSWLGVAPGGRWLDLGCGTGALTWTILETADPEMAVGVDSSAGFARYAREQVGRPHSHFLVGDARAFPCRDASFDVVASGLVLNFVPTPGRAVGEMVRAAKAGAVVAAYVWDYAGEMQLMRHFWDAAVALDPAVSELDEGRRFPLCRPEPLGALFREAGLREVEVRAIDVPTHFRDFDDYWSPFLGGQGPAPTYAMSLTEERRAALRERIRVGLPLEPDGAIRRVARAWAVRGRR
ncbi:MAG: methyltransferase domain-containing protein [Thermomicrobiales bacterium]